MPCARTPSAPSSSATARRWSASWCSASPGSSPASPAGWRRSTTRSSPPSIVGAVPSGFVLLMAYIGGVAFFFGPIIGAVLMTALQISLSDYTGAWLLYVGLMFVLVVMFAPWGLAGFVADAPAAAGGRHVVACLPAYALALAAGGDARGGPRRADRDGAPPAGQRRARQRDAAARVSAYDAASPLAWGVIVALLVGRHLHAAAGGSEGVRRLSRGRTRGRAAAGARMSELRRCNCRTCTRASAPRRSSAASTSTCGAASATPSSGPTAPASPRCSTWSAGASRSARARSCCNGEDITGLAPYMINRRGLSRSFQVTNIFPRLSVFENMRCGVLWSLGYTLFVLAARRRRARRDRAQRVDPRADQPRSAPRHAGRRAVLCRAARAGDRHHDRRRRRRDPARRADRRHEPHRDRARGGADPPRHARARRW